jgi:hypothetical protein
MLYDTAQESPEPGSLLESLFLVLSKRRQEQEFLKTRVLAEAALAPHLEKNNLKETFDDYASAMFPYLKSEREKRDKITKQALEHWTSKKAFKVKPLWTAKNNAKGLRSKLAAGAERVQQLEAERKSGRLKRI